ncbi:hypothetical protein N7474_006269 [Penicillium riverlandense]|uniref:uncharacterized protein n=1 Tax=Penicillium riverlandense TaxID=1903569 RepID=UPI0025478799|nr:uncharacterized protein N7474_006269 [Penicillium riverlandense]KAJ5814492.1 hypothetical protein N7474_006269 [Penicillium riverlandense]
MVSINSAAEAAVAAYSAAIALGGNYSVPLQEAASEVSSFFLPNYSSFTMGKITLSSNQSVVAENFIKEYDEFRASGGPGTDVHVTHSRVEAVSDESALCWLTYHICPINGMQGWDWTNVYGFRIVKGGIANGLEGGWEFAIGDNEDSQYTKRFPNAS